MPQMLPVHFTMLKRVFELQGYKVDMLTTNHRGIVDEGLWHVHNDTCYPALLVIGQLIDAVKSGKYDPHKVGLFITQTGGGCRASNYIHLLRKALKRAGYGYVPVVSVNLSGLEKNPGFSLGFGMIIQMAYSMIYGDILVNLANQCRPYEIVEGRPTAVSPNGWSGWWRSSRKRGRSGAPHVVENFNAIVDDFASIPVHRTKNPGWVSWGRSTSNTRRSATTISNSSCLTRGVSRWCPVSWILSSSNATTGWRTI